MKMAGMMALCAVASAASWEHKAVEGVNHPAQTIIGKTEDFGVGKHTVLHYIGYGRGAKVQSGEFPGDMTGSNAGCAPKIHLVYAARDNAAIAKKTCAKKKNGSTCVTQDAKNGQMCAPAVYSEQNVCIAVEEVSGHGFGDAENEKFDWVESATEIPGDGVAHTFKSHGTLNYEWFVRVEFERQAICNSNGYGVSMKSMQPVNPEQTACVARSDDEQQGFGNSESKVRYESVVPGNLHQYPFLNVTHNNSYFAEHADLPMNPDAKFIMEDLFVAGPSGSEKSTSHYWNLGASPQIDFSCLMVWLTAAGKADQPECQAVQKDVGSDAKGDWSFNLIEVSDCGIAPYPESDCCAMRKEECSLPNSVGKNLCWWNAQEKQCYETPKQKIDLRTRGQGSNDNLDSTTMMHSVISNEVNGAQSSWVTDIAAIQRGIQGYNRKRWFFELEMNDKPATGRCEWSATVSFASHTTGGVCEPTTRSRCDTQADACFANNYPVTAWPRFWRHYETPTKIVADHSEALYKQCNCLKQKEVCYRQGGCYTTKKYQMILENCNDIGCGNWCNSAGAAQWSFAALLVAALALVL